MLLYGNETWVLKKSDISRIGIFKEIRPKQECGVWRIKYTENYTKYLDFADLITDLMI